ncbi:L,D-transpeptidase family protein [Paracoccus aestuariivivens]|uniref:L,D-transpeptidase family protein n=2 Tax=Paracoccus aestuariivivens TaxID=1820333 RepID=A0A6L6JHH3_9RHOB|nr:L,D-transpeptidase family protein [Paracoccus aestuariivivens]
MGSRLIRSLVVVGLVAFSGAGLPAAAHAQGLEAASLAALPAPRLIFSDDEMALARAVAGSPGLADFYGSNGLKRIFSGPEAAIRRNALINAIETASSHGLPPSRYNPARLLELDGEGGASLQAELAFARSFARWTQDLTGGVLDPRKVSSGIKRAVHRKPTGEMMREFVAAPDPAAWLADLAPHDKDYLALQQALHGMSRLAAPVGTPKVPNGTWREGSEGEGVLLLRERLAAIGFPARPTGDMSVFDAALGQSVAEFQDASGLHADGVAGPHTVARMNRGIGPEAKGILIALERMRWMHGYDMNARHVWVNLPSYTATIRENGETVFSTKVVIGKDEDTHETPEFSENMKHVVANPRWNVPRSITVKEYLPRLQANRNAVSHIDVVDRAGNIIPRSQIDFGRYTASNFPYRMRQKSSDDNALGVVKFLFPNPWNIYLHDTPTKHLFNETRRAYSHGCIRVGRPLDLANELLKGQFANPEARFSKALASGRESYLNLTHPLPVHLVYFTAFPDENGKIRRYPDIYGRDAAVYAALVKAGLDSGLETGGQGN